MHEQGTTPRRTRKQHADCISFIAPPKDKSAQRLPDALGKCALKLNKTLTPHEFYALVDKTRGRYELNPLGVHEHPAAPFLNHLRKHGAEVKLDTPASAARLAAQLKKGAHPSAHLRAEFLRGDILDQVNKGHLLVLPLSAVRDLPDLWITPAACIPQEDRRDRPIYDYTYSGLNQAVIPSAPPEAMQLGRALPRLLRRIVRANPRLGPVLMSKTDLSDAYMRVWINIPDVAKLAFAIPPAPGDTEPLIGFHLSCPMGYVESAPFFCATTETVADFANNDEPRTQPHKLEKLAESEPSDDDPAHAGILTADDEELLRKLFEHASKATLHERLEYTDVYVDDFILLCQGPKHVRKKALRNLFHNIDRVFRPNDDHDTDRREVNSLKKLAKGDACFTYVKKILGWMINSISMHMTITPTRFRKVQNLLAEVKHVKRTTTRVWHRLLGTLRSLAPGIAGGRGLFSVLQAAMPKHGHRVRITDGVRHVLDLWEHLFATMNERPTHLRELFPHAPNWFGATDACGHGLGGVFFDNKGTAYVWQWQVPPELQARLRTRENPKGDLTINVLELAAHIVQLLLKGPMAKPLDHTLDGVDSTAAFGWTLGGSVTRTDKVATLLSWKALELRNSCLASSCAYVPGPLNRLADDASRVQHDSPTNLLHMFNAKYPQKHSWRYAPLTSAIDYALTTVLSGRPWRPESLPVTPKCRVPNGPYGRDFAPESVWTPNSRTSAIPSHFSKFLRIECAEENSQSAATPSAAGRSTATSAPWDRASPAWGPTTPVTTSTEKPTSAFQGSYAATKEKILHRNGSNQSQRPSFTISSKDAAEAAQNNNASQTSYGSPSTSSCDPASIAARDATTRPKRSVSGTSLSVKTNARWTHTATPSRSYNEPITSPSRSQNKKTESKEKPLAHDEAATQLVVRFSASLTEWRTFDAEAPPATSLSPATTTDTNGVQSKARTSPMKYELASQQSVRASAYNLMKSQHAPYAQAAQWRSSSQASTPTSSASSAAGEATQCYATSTSPHAHSHTTTHASCTPPATTTSSHPQMTTTHKLGTSFGEPHGLGIKLSKLTFMPSRASYYSTAQPMSSLASGGRGN